MIGKRFVVIDTWGGKRLQGHPFRGVLCDRLHGTRPVMEKIWYYLHRTGCHGVMKQTSREAERRLRRYKKKVIYGE